MKDLIKTIGSVIILAVAIFGAAYFHWWRCGEMFPNAQFACFVGG